MGEDHYSLGRLLLTRGQYRVGSLQFKGLIFPKQQEGETKAVFLFLLGIGGIASVCRWPVVDNKIKDFLLLIVLE